MTIAKISATMEIDFETGTSKVDIKFENFPEIDPDDWPEVKYLVHATWCGTMRGVTEQIERDHPELLRDSEHISVAEPMGRPN